MAGSDVDPFWQIVVPTSEKQGKTSVKMGLVGVLTSVEKRAIREEWLGAVCSGDVVAACVLVPRMVGCGASFAIDAIVEAICRCPCLHMEPSYVEYASKRLASLDLPHYGKDRRALCRVVCEMTAAFASAIKQLGHIGDCVKRVGANAWVPDLKTVRDGDRPVVVTQQVENAFHRARDATSPSEMARVMTEELLAITKYSNAVLVPGVPIRLCKDPIWIAWLCVTKGDAVSAYCKQLYALYSIGFKRTERRSRSTLLHAALEARACGNTLQCSKKQVLVPVVVEAVLKIGFLVRDASAS